MFSSCNFDQERTIFVDSQNLVKSETSDIIFVLMEKLSMSKTSILRDRPKQNLECSFYVGI